MNRLDVLLLVFFLVLISSLLVLGFFKHQVILVVLSGVGLILFGVFLLRGVDYVVGSSTNTSYTYNNYTYGTTDFLVVNESVESVGVVTGTWTTSYNPYLFFFFSLVGLYLIFLGVLEFLGGRGFSWEAGGGHDDEEE